MALLRWDTSCWYIYRTYRDNELYLSINHNEGKSLLLSRSAARSLYENKWWYCLPNWESVKEKDLNLAIDAIKRFLEEK